MLIDNGEIGASIDSSMTDIQAPKAMYKAIKEQLQKIFEGSMIQLEEFMALDVIAYLYFPRKTCNDIISHAGNLPNFTITLKEGNKEKKLHIPPDSYLKDFVYDYYGDTAPHCRFMLYNTFVDGFIQLGTAFLENYVTAYDMDKHRVGFKGYIEQKDLGSSSPVPLWAILTLSGIVGGSAILAVILYYNQWQRKKKAEVDKED